MEMVVMVEMVKDMMALTQRVVLVLLPLLIGQVRLVVQMLEMVVQEEPEEEVVKEEPLVLMVVQEIKEILAIADHLEV